MTFRSLSDIFTPEQHYLFDYEEVRQWCADNAHAVMRPDHLVELIKREENPFIREYKAGECATAYRQRVEECHLPITYEQMEDFELAITRIIRDCMCEQTVYLWKRTDGQASTNEATPSLAERREASINTQKQLERMQAELERMQAEIDHLYRMQDEPYCTYIVADSSKSRDEIEDDLQRTSKQSASVFASCLLRLEKQGCLDFGNDKVSTIFHHLRERYRLPYGYANFSGVFPSRRRKI